MTRLRSRMALAAAFVCMTVVVSLAQQTTTSTESKTFEVLGVDGNQLIVRLPEGTSELTVADDFRFIVNGKPLSVSELKAGIKGTATITTRTTVTPVTVTEVKNGTVVQRSGDGIVGRTTEGVRRFSQGEVDKRGVSAQGLNACALLTLDEIQPLAAETTVADGVSNSFEAFGYVACRYTWGAGTGRFKLDVIVNEAPRMFPGMSADGIKQQLLGSVRAGTADAVIPEIGEAAVFKPDSPVYASAIAFVKGRILGVHLDGAFAREMKDQVVGLLKSAASRL